MSYFPVATKIEETAGPTTLTIAGITDGQFLKRSGTTVTSGTAASTSPGGSNTQVQFNDSGAFGGDAGLTYDKASDVLSLNGKFQPIGTSGTQDMGDSTHEWGTANFANYTVQNTGSINFRSAVKLDDGAAAITNGGILRLRNNANAGATWSSPVLSPAQITSNQNDYNTGAAYCQRWTSNASRDVTGFEPRGAASGNVSGEVHLIVNAGSNNIVLKHQNTGSVATNRFLCSTGADITLSADQAADLVYDSTTARWRVFKQN